MATRRDHRTPASTTSITIGSDVFITIDEQVAYHRRMTAPSAPHPGGRDPRPGRPSRQRARTRTALVEAAQRLLAEQHRADLSIREITDAADVGFGTFYGHFADKSDLLEAAMSLSLEQHCARLDTAIGGLTDPAGMIAVGVRLTARLPRSCPQVARLLLHVGLSRLDSPVGLAPRARHVLRLGTDTPGVRSAQILAHLGVQLREALDVRLVDDGLRPRGGEQAVALPVEARIDDEPLGDRRRRRPRRRARGRRRRCRRGCTAACSPRSQRISSLDRLRVGVDEQLGAG